MSTSLPRVVIAGGGIAAVEAMLALTEHARDRVDVTLVAADPHFRLPALSVAEPFAPAPIVSHALPHLCTERGARYVQSDVEAVDPIGQAVRLVDPHRLVPLDQARTIPFDALLIAVGARHIAMYERGVAFRGFQNVADVRRIVDDVDAGFRRRIAFVVPPGTTWPLPLYELALLFADRLGRSDDTDAELDLVTPERAPLEVFGATAATAVGRELRDAAITLHVDTEVGVIERGRVVDRAGETVCRADGVIHVPFLLGPRISGVPRDDDGFLPTDADGRVGGAAAVWAAGDATTFPVKQGGIAAQQADAAAMSILRALGIQAPAHPFQPVLRAELLAGSRTTWLRGAVEGDEGAAARHALWWPPTKVAAPYLSAYLAGQPHSEHPTTLHATGDPAGGVELLG